MINPNDILQSVVTALQAIPGLSDVATIEAYDGESQIYRSLQEALDNLNYPTLIFITWDGAEAETSSCKSWTHHVSLYLRCQSLTSDGTIGYFDLIQMITDGRPGGGWRFTESEIHPDADPVQDFSVASVRDDDRGEFFHITFGVTEKH
ncbi:MAG: hypothetical protein J0H49_10675 [Acidobacteria bacterium]|nr:hypothetical protein [Acidobacteriota bacterium]